MVTAKYKAFLNPFHVSSIYACNLHLIHWTYTLKVNEINYYVFVNVE